MSLQVFGFGEVLGLARPAKLHAAAQGLAAMASLARLAAAENTQLNGRTALADFGWDATSLIECRIRVATQKGFFGCSFADAPDDETSTLRRAQ